jgi:hypothetical protein
MTPSDTRMQTALQSAQAAMDFFECAAKADRSVQAVVSGLEQLVHASVTWPDLPAIAPDLAARAPAVILAAGVIVSAAVAAPITAEKIHFGLGSASALLTNGLDDFWPDRLAYAVMLAAELKVFLCRTELDRRGDPLWRAVLARRAWDASPMPAGRLQ